MLKIKMITNLFLISITIICFSNSVFAFEQKIFRNEINLDGEVSYAAKICKDSALVNVYKGNPYEEELTRIDLNTLTTKVLYKVYPLSNVFNCDPDTGNYFFIDPVHKNGEATILAYAPGQPEQFLWKYTLNSTDYESIQDL